MVDEEVVVEYCSKTSSSKSSMGGVSTISIDHELAKLLDEYDDVVSDDLCSGKTLPKPMTITLKDPSCIPSSKRMHPRRPPRHHEQAARALVDKLVEHANIKRRHSCLCHIVLKNPEVKMFAL